MHLVAILHDLGDAPDLEDSLCVQPYRGFLTVWMISSTGCSVNMTARRNCACRGSPCWRVGRPTTARRWPACWASTAIRSAAGWPLTPPGVFMPCWRPTSPQANRSRSRRQGSPAWRRPSTGPKASPPMRPCATGGAGPTAWRSRTRRAIPSCAPAARPRARWPGRRTPNNPEAIPTFQATGHDHLQQAIPPDHRRPLRVFSQDESRFGLVTVRRRRLTAQGVQPSGPVPHVFAWFSVYGAVEPITGDRFFLERP
jgi:hypothetical protein